MKKRIYILTVALAILVALSLVGNYILFNQFYNTKQTLGDIQIQLTERKVELQSAQAEWETLQASLKDAQYENIKLLAYEERQLSPEDPNNVLPNGITLGEAKVVIDDFIKSAVEAGISVEDAKESAGQVAKELGTSLEEVMSIQEDASVQTPTPQPQPKPQPKPYPEPTPQPKPEQPTNNDGAGKYPVSELDKDENGIRDDFENKGDTGLGGTTPDDDFGLN